MTSLMVRVHKDLAKVIGDIKKRNPGISKVKISKKVAKFIKNNMEKPKQLNGFKFRV